MTTIREWYGRVNAAWPKEVPPLTFEAGANAVSRLHRHVLGVPWTGEIRETSGARYSWPRRGIFFLNTNGHTGSANARRGNGWKCLIHDLSHYLVQRAWVDRVRPHAREHARLELKLIKEVVKRGWLNPPAPKAEEESSPAPLTVRNHKLAAIEAALKRWATKKKRAETALKKLAKRKRYYERKVIA